MGFRTGAFCSCWGEMKRVSPTLTRGRVSISRKDKNSGEYVQDFGGFVSFIGTACAQKALKLKEKDRIKLGEVDVTNSYNKETGKEYTNFNVYGFEMASGSNSGNGNSNRAASVDDGDPGEGELPF